MSIVLEKMQKADLAVQPGNVKLTTFKMNLVGFVVGKGALPLNLEKLQAIIELLHLGMSSAFSTF